MNEFLKIIDWNQSFRSYEELGGRWFKRSYLVSDGFDHDFIGHGEDSLEQEREIERDGEKEGSRQWMMVNGKRVFSDGEPLDPTLIQPC